MRRQTKKILIFLGLTFLVDWSMVYIYMLAGGATEGLMLLAMAYMLVPMTAAIIVQKAIFREPLAKPLGISFHMNPWFFVAWFLPVIIAFAVMGVSLLLPGISFTPDMTGFFNSLQEVLTPEQITEAQQQLAGLATHPIWIGVLVALIAGTTFNAILAFGEELGWRGFLVKELGFMGFWKSSLLIGFIWGIWHAPLVLYAGLNYPGHPQAGVFIMTAWVIIVTPLFNYIRIKSRSVIAASIFHGTINAVPVLAVMMITGGDELTAGISGLAGFIVFIIIDILIFIYDRFFSRERANLLLMNISTQ
ncbi:MAG: CPBP family intramembrane metalloprotease [Dehalococcoidia bacterium]|nr:CPBP family intramembrane metalloprotease [Dehalococcoidia bacterium]